LYYGRKGWIDVYNAATIDFKIKEDGPTALATKGVNYAEVQNEYAVSVMGKVALQQHLAHIIASLFADTYPSGQPSILMSAHPICTNPKNVAFFGQLGKGCLETSYNAWTAANAGCTMSECCHDPRANIVNTSGSVIGYKPPPPSTMSTSDPNWWNKNYTCTAEPEPPSTNTIQGDGLY
jgi:hypothetical protein